MAEAPSRPGRRPARWAAWLLVATISSGCVGVLSSDLQYVPVTKGGLRTRTDVRETFGEPRRKTSELDQEVWYYFLTRRGVSDRAPSSKSIHGVFLVILPLVWWITPEDNVKFTFRGTQLDSVSELRDKGTGFLCGVVLLHGFHTTCGAVE